MADIHLRRIVNALEKLFDGKIDLSDYAGKPEAEVKSNFITRGLAAYTIYVESGCSPDVAANSVTDGYKDGGIDAIYYDRNSSTFFLCQSKWNKDGSGSISQGDTLKFLSGCKKLLNLDFTDLNQKIIAKKQDISDAVLETDVNINLLITHTGTSPIGNEPQGEIDAFTTEINSPTPVVATTVTDQSRLYSLIQTGHQRANIDLDITLTNWGFLADPIDAFYGSVSARDIFSWWDNHGADLLIRNIRDFKGRTDVNDALIQTVNSEPDKFWYFNNGITLLCDTVKKSLLGGSGRDSAVFECKGVSVVNGAQTVGSIGRSCTDARMLDEAARVHLRIISLEKCPDEFDQRVTRATNTQNRIEGRDFAAIDPNQRRLASEFYLDKLRYSYKSGEPEPSPTEGCTLTEATVALACFNDDVALSTQVKNQIGRIFDDLTAAPYTDLFHDKTDSAFVWRTVLILRHIDAELERLKQHGTVRSDLVATHANRFIAHRVMQDRELRRHADGTSPIVVLADAVKSKTKTVFTEVANDLNTYESQSYLASLFKNRTRCRDLEARLNAATTKSASATPPGSDLFTQTDTES